MAPASQIDMGDLERWTTTPFPIDDLKLGDNDVDSTCRFSDETELMNSLLFDDNDDGSSSTISDEHLMAVVWQDDNFFESSYAKNISCLKKRRRRDDNDDDGVSLPVTKKRIKDSMHDVVDDNVGIAFDKTFVIPPLPQPNVRRSWKRPVCTFLNFFGTRQYQEMASNNNASTSTSTAKQAIAVPTPAPTLGRQLCSPPQQQQQPSSPPLPPPLPTGNPTPNFLFPICPCKLKHQVNAPKAIAPPILQLLSSTTINFVCQPTTTKPIFCQSSKTLDDDSNNDDDDDDDDDDEDSNDEDVADASESV